MAKSTGCARVGLARALDNNNNIISGIYTYDNNDNIIIIIIRMVAKSVENNISTENETSYYT